MYIKYNLGNPGEAFRISVLLFGEWGVKWKLECDFIRGNAQCFGKHCNGHNMKDEYPQDTLIVSESKRASASGFKTSVY